MIAVLLLVKATILLALVATVQRLFGSRVSAATRHLACALTVLALLMLPVIAIALPEWTAVRLPDRASGRTFTPALVSAQADASLASPTESMPGAISMPVAAEAAAVGNNRQAQAAPPVSWPLVAAIVYVAGVMLLLVRMAAQRWSIARLTRVATEMRDPQWQHLLDACAARAGARRTVRLLRTASETMPMAFGIVRPAIMMPAIADTWTDARREAVLLHELAHVARLDCLTQALSTVACALYWIHPGVWWVARRLRVERELACDDAVLTSGADAPDYASHLLELAYDLRSGVAPALAVSMASPRQLEGRMLAALDRARNRATPAFGWRMAGFALMTAILVPVATATTGTTAAAAMTRIDAAPPASPAAPATAAAPAASVAAKTAPPQQAAADETGTWEIRPSQERGAVYLRLGEADGFHGSTIDIARLSGLAPSLLTGAGGPAGFSLRRDAGTFTCEGIVTNGIGAGTFTFRPNASFAAELVHRGFERPTNTDLRMLAYAEVGPAFLDELTAQGYARPTLAQLIRSAQHGVTPSYLREMGALGYRAGRLDLLVELRDHGVTPEYVRGLAAQRMPHLSADELRRARDHGLTPEYLRAVRDAGYRPADLDAFITLRDHGITPEYIKEMRDLGFNLTLEQITDARNHGIVAEYVRGLSALGYKGLSMDALINLRNHGITPDYVQQLSAVGYTRLSPDELVNLRNHGVTPDYVREFNALGYAHLRIDELVALRNHGVTSDKVTQANQRAGTRLPVDRLTAMAERGWR